jgi:hypothetical protein
MSGGSCRGFLEPLFYVGVADERGRVQCTSPSAGEVSGFFRKMGRVPLVVGPNASIYHSGRLL